MNAEHTSGDQGEAPPPAANQSQAEPLADDRARNAFLANLRHELRTPIGAVIG